jgi:hypothetical protein
MIKILSLTALFILFNCFAFSQNRIDNAYLLRQLINKDSSVRVPNTGVWILKNAGIRKEHFGWLLEDEFAASDSDMLYFEMNTTDVPNGSWQEYAPGSVQLAINLPKEISSLNFDTINKLTYQLINNYTGFAWKQKPINTLSGTITIKLNDNKEKIIDGTINIDTKNPSTKQKIVFNNYSISVFTLDEYIAIQKKQEEIKNKQQQKMMGAFDLVSKERSLFYDSVFNLKKYPDNKISAKINNKTAFDFTLNNSYILVNASLTDSAKHDLVELLGGNILATVQGNKKVFVFHSFYDPIANAIDDETNYSFSIELDSIINGKTYYLNKKTNDFVAKLAYWHYGPEGRAIISKDVSGSLTITKDNQTFTFGTLDLKFKNTDKTTFILNGTFELPKLKLNDISDLESRIKLKLVKYYSEE